MIFNYVLTEQDYIEFNIFHYSNSPAMKKQQIFMVVSVPVVLILIALFYILFIRPESIIAPILICILISFVWVLGFPMIMKNQIKKQVTKLMDEGKKDDLTGEFTMIIDEEGITDGNTCRTVKSSFDTIEKITMDDKRLYIYNSAMSAFMIPHSAFGSTEKEDKVVAFIKEKSGI